MLPFQNSILEITFQNELSLFLCYSEQRCNKDDDNSCWWEIF